MKIPATFLARTVLTLAALAFMTACSSDQTDSPQNTENIDSTIIPNSELSGATIYLSRRGHINAEIHALKIRQIEGKDSMMIYGVRIKIFDSSGQVGSHIIGDSGLIRESANQHDLFGNVLVTTRDSVRLESDYLKWNSTQKKITTDAFVRITVGDDVVTGWGLDADQDLSRWKILKQVSGKVVDPGSRLDEN